MHILQERPPRVSAEFGIVANLQQPAWSSDTCRRVPVALYQDVIILSTRVHLVLNDGLDSTVAHGRESSISVYVRFIHVGFVCRELIGHFGGGEAKAIQLGFAFGLRNDDE